METRKIIEYLDNLLEIKKINDASINGLQVEGSANIKKIAGAVDLSLATIEQCITKKAELLIVHHGLFWKNSIFTLTGINKKRIELLLKHNINLYAAHLPLDLHSKYGNNITICKLLKLQKIQSFGEYNNIKIGYCGELKKTMAFDDFLKYYKTKISDYNAFINGCAKVKKICIVSGGGAGLFNECLLYDADTFITGEQNYTICNFAKENKINIIFGGHYNTEIFGAREIIKHLKNKFRLQAEFIDCPSSI